ncbi:MAG: peptidylprolyl isomerase [Nitrososphaerales archaeon]
MPHSSKKYKKQESKSSSRPATKWIVVIVLVAVIVVLPGMYLTYPPMSAAVQSVFGLSSSNNTISTTSSETGCSNSSNVYALIDTSQGVIEVELFQGLTPKTVNNFVSLAKSGFYNNLVWHRIVKGFVIQTGDPNTRNGGGNQATWGTGGSNTSVPLEVVNCLPNNEGYLGMAHTSASTSATSQFYINLANNTDLDGQYTVFGKVIKGMNVVQTLASLAVNSQDVPANPQQAMMISVTIQNTP